MTNFTISDLKDGMVFQMTRGGKYLVVENKLWGRSEYDGTLVPYINVNSYFNDDLTHNNNSSEYIEKVFYMGELIWERTVDKDSEVRVQYNECQQKLNELQQQMVLLEKQLNS